MPVVEYLDYHVLDDYGWDLDEEDLFEKAAAADLDEEAYGTLEVTDDYVLRTAEMQGLEWPYSCRAGACANCSAIVKEGDLEMDKQKVLSEEEVEEKGVRLTCGSRPVDEEVKIVFNAKYLDYLRDRVV